MIKPSSQFAERTSECLREIGIRMSLSGPVRESIDFKDCELSAVP
jgi:hypothetical protein